MKIDRPQAFVKSLLAVVALSGALTAYQFDASPRLLHGEPPPLPPPTVIAGGQVVVEALVDLGGRVSRARLLRTTEPYDRMVLAALAQWRFSPARGLRSDGTEGDVARNVLIVAVYRPPSFPGGLSLGEPPRTLGAPSPDVPYPLSIVVPPYPPLALAGSVVMLEIEIDERGSVTRARAVRSDPGFDAAAIDVLKDWQFRPASINGQRASSVAYIVFGFSQPVMTPPPSLPAR